MKENLDQLPDFLRAFMDSDTFKNAIQPDGSVKFTNTLESLKKVQEELRKARKSP